MPQQQYIKYLYEQEDLSISQISARVSVDWRTNARYARKDDWEPQRSVQEAKQAGSRALYGHE